MKALRRIGWWCSLFALITVALYLWRIETHWAGNQDDRLAKLGAEIWENPEQWKGATVDGRHAQGWQKELHVGHGVLMSVTTWKQGVLAGLSLFLGMTLAISKIRKRARPVS
jgi:hypothetical protein